MSDCERLSSNRLFKGLDVGVIRNLLEEISYKKTVYQKNDIIAMDGDKVYGQYIMLTGGVIGQMTNYQGKVVKIEDIEGCQLIAPAFLYGSDNHYPVDIIVSKPTEIIFIEKENFSYLLHINTTVQQNFLNIISGKTQFLSNKIKFLALQPIKGKIASYILKRTRNNPGNTIVLPYSQENLADLFGVTRPALARAFGELTQDQILDIKGKKITVLNEHELKTLIQ